MDSVNKELYDSKVNRAAMLRLHENKITKEIRVEIDKHFYTLEEFLKNRELRNSLDSATSEKLDRMIFKTYGNLRNLQEARLLSLFGDEVGYMTSVMGLSLGRLFEIHRPTKNVGQEIVLKRPLYNDVTLEAGWYNLALAERKRVEHTIRAGIAEGKPIVNIARDVRATAPVSITQSVGLARTSVTSVAAQADLAVYERNDKMLRGYRYVAVLDSRTTAICAFRDGKIYAVDDRKHLPPAHWNCRSTTVPIVRSFESLKGDNSLLHLRKKNFDRVSEKEIQRYDGEAYGVGSYDAWLRSQPTSVQQLHLGSNQAVDMFNSGRLTLDKFEDNGRLLTLTELRKNTDSGYGLPGDTVKFAIAKQQLDSLDLGASSPDDFISDKQLEANLRKYYLLQTRGLDGQLSLTNYRGVNLGSKKQTKTRVLTKPPSEEQLRFNPLTGRYEDTRRYSPMPAVLNNSYRLIDESKELTPRDKVFIRKFVDSLEDEMSVNERAVVSENLRVLFTRYRKNGDPWTNFKAVAQAEIKFDIMNISDMLETSTRRDSDVLKRLSNKYFVDPVLGERDLQSLHDSLIDNIKFVNKWEDGKVHSIGRRLTWHTRKAVPLHVYIRLSSEDIALFNSRLILRLAAADSPDRDQLAMSIGRDLYMAANYRGSKREWFEVGNAILDDLEKDGVLVTKTFGVQKRRMKSRNGGRYFGPYYDTEMRYIEIQDKDMLEYARKKREVDVGMRIGIVGSDRNRFIVRKGFKTYFIKETIGYYDTRVPVVSASSMKDFPVDVIDEDMANAMNWAAQSEYKVDQDFYKFMHALLYYQDDKGRAKHFNELNTYREYIIERGDTYERFKMMEYLVEGDKKVSNLTFLDHRGRMYERGYISPQSGESFRPYLNTAESKKFSRTGFLNLQDQIGAFLGGASDRLEGRYNSLSVSGRQGIAAKHRAELVKLGNHMRRGKPKDIQAVLESKLVQELDGEEQAKLLRFAIEMAKIDEFLGGKYDRRNLERLSEYDIALALEQDASSSGAQIIALTTRNKQLAELSNVVPTNQKARLYDVIANDTYNDPRFKKINRRLGLTEKDLRKAAKAQNMVTLYGAGERTGIMNVENKLAKALEKDGDTLVIKAAERDQVLEEISARAARYEKTDPVMHAHLLGLRKEVRDMFNKGQPIGDDIMEELYFLDPKTQDIVEKMGRQYGKVVTPDDFAEIAGIMSEHLGERVPILRDFTKYFGRLSEAYLTTAKPSKAAFDYTSIAKRLVFNARKSKRPVPPAIARVLGIKNDTIRESLLKRFGWWDPDDLVDNMLFGASSSTTRREGFVYGDVGIFGEKLYKGREVGYPNKLPKSWTNVPWVNFDGKILEQNFTQSYEERLVYRKDGQVFVNIVQVQQKSEPNWWEEFRNKDGKFNDIADVQKARTAFAVNGE